MSPSSGDDRDRHGELGGLGVDVGQRQREHDLARSGCDSARRARGSRRAGRRGWCAARPIGGHVGERARRQPGRGRDLPVVRDVAAGGDLAVEDDRRRACRRAGPARGRNVDDGCAARIGGMPGRAASFGSRRGGRAQQLGVEPLDATTCGTRSRSRCRSRRSRRRAARPRSRAGGGARVHASGGGDGASVPELAPRRRRVAASRDAAA